MVQRVAKEIEPDVDVALSKLEEYQTLLDKHLPITQRVELITKIARKADSNPFAAMRALERADDLDGIIRARDESRRPSQDVGETRPMFLLPAGTHISVSVNPIESEKRKEMTLRQKGIAKTPPPKSKRPPRRTALCEDYSSYPFPISAAVGS
jgi:hypothetical protein